MERSKRTPTEVDLKKMGERLDQLERDIATIARLAWPHVGPEKDPLIEIAERHTVGGQETRPSLLADEQRKAVV